MIWYLLALIGGTLLTAAGIYLAFRFRKDKLDDFIEWSEGKVKRFLKIWGMVLVIITLALTKPLWKTTTCQFDGWAANTETSYSWYKSQCLYKSKTGAWLPLMISRDQPQGDSDYDVN